MLFSSDKIVVPTSLRKEALECLHNGHQGINKMLTRARDSVYWPGITNQIKMLTSGCSRCLDYRNRQAAETIIPHEIPEVPWTKVATDALHIRGESYVIVADYTSKFFDTQKIDDCESSTVISHLKSTFSKFGIP